MTNNAASAESQRRGSNPDVASLGRLGNVDADDAVQDALLPALTHVDQLKGRAQSLPGSQRSSLTPLA